MRHYPIQTFTLSQSWFVAILIVVWWQPLRAMEFRTFNGSNNVLSDPLQGSSGSTFIRFGYGHRYDDVLGDVLKSGLPNPRDLSNQLNTQSISVPNSRHLSDWVVQWGQFLTHDLTLASTGGNGDFLSSGEMKSFHIPVNDPHDPLGPNMIPFHRTNYGPATGIPGPPNVAREQINEVTSYLDASHIYGSDVARADALRTFSDGQLITSAGGKLPGHNTHLLPNQDPLRLGPTLFLAGDIRANENASLIAIHTLFVREHNRLANLLQQQNDNLSDNDIYQIARKIVGAEVQKITYEEFLPAFLGPYAPAAEDYIYDPSMDATITNSFAAAFFRFGHSMQSSNIKLVDNTGQQTGNLAVRDAFFNVGLFSDPNNVDLILHGLADQVAQENDLLVVDELRNFLFGPPGAGGMDLAALDIQRGRDHGLPGYNSLRLAYGLLLKSLSQISSDTSITQALSNFYGSAGAVDAWIAGQAEDHLPGASAGELIVETMVSQFERLRDGDRFFYVSDPDLQLDDVKAVIQLEDITLADIIKHNTDISLLQDNVFFVADKLRCDWNGDLACDVYDINALYTEVHSQGNLGASISTSKGNRFDLNGDEQLNQSDLSQWLSEAAVVNGYTSSYLRGDTDNILPNGNRDVDITDFNQLSSHFDPSGAAGAANTWQRGNFDGDLDIDITDFNFLSQNFSPIPYSQSVPEPTVFQLLLLGGLVCWVLMGRPCLLRAA